MPGLKPHQDAYGRATMRNWIRHADERIGNLFQVQEVFDGAPDIRIAALSLEKDNAEALSARGVVFVGPDEGEMACGEFGPGQPRAGHRSYPPYRLFR